MSMSTLRRLLLSLLIGAVVAACGNKAPTQRPTFLAMTPTPPNVDTPTPPDLPTSTRLPPSTTSLARVLAGYYAGWSANRYPVSAIPAGQLTHVIYAFANISASGECVASKPTQDSANWQALQSLKQDHPQLKLLLSVGGWSQSGLFSDVAASADSRAHFAESCAAFMQANGFDGLDVDWEFPVSGGLPTNHTRPEDGLNFTALLSALRTALNAQAAGSGRHYLLTIAAPAGPSEYQHLELRLIAPYLDWINLMAYDFTTAASPTTNFNAPLFAAAADPAAAKRKPLNDAAAVQAYLAAGVPAHKLILGTALYGRGWQGVPAANDGLYQSNTGPAQGSFAADGVFSYGDLETRLLPVYTRHFARDAQVPWLYNPGTQTFITYEDPESLGLKADYAVGQNLGGMMFWELSMDDAQHNVLNALYTHLGK